MLCVLLAAAPGSTQEATGDNAPTQGLAYEPRIQGVDGNLRDLITESTNLFRMRDRLPSSVPALRARLEADLDIIEKILRSEGYYAFRVEHRIDARQQPATVAIDITPGPVYRLESYEIRYVDGDGGRPLPSDQEQLGITLGQPARAEAIVAAQAELIRLLGEQGHPYAAVEARQVLAHHEDRSVTVALDVRAGAAVTLGDVTVMGSDHVEEAYISRLTSLRQGDEFTFSSIDAARRRLFESGLFDSVTVTWPKDDAGQEQVPITVEVKERDPRTIAAGINYSTTEGIGVDTSWTHRNLFGRGERIELGARFAEKGISGYGDFLKPNVGRLDQNITGRFDLKELETEAYDQSSIGAAVGVQRKLSPRWNASLATAIEGTEIREPNQSEKRYLILSLPGQLAYDGTDNLFDPSLGTRLTFDVAPHQVTGDSSANFLLASVAGSAYQQVLPEKRLVLAARARVATLLGAERDEIPASRRLYAGGGGSVRGYAHQTAGPLTEAGIPIGGLSLLETSFEARIRVTESFGIVPFIDGGAAFDDSWPSGDTLQWAAGIGFRYYTPIGPLRFDIATPLNPRDNVDDSYAIYISLGQAF